MKKTVLILVALLMSMGFSFAGEEALPLDNLAAGWGSSYDVATTTITFDGAWNGRGWWFGDPGAGKDCSSYNKVVVNFEATEFQVQIMVQYNVAGVADSKVLVEPGATSISVDLDEVGKSDVQQIYFQPSAAGTLTLVSASLTGGGAPAPQPSSVIDFSSDAVDATYPAVAWGAGDINAVVENNPDGDGNVLHVTSTNWNAYPKFTVTLPDGKTLADIDSIACNIYLGTNGSSDQNSYKHFDYFMGSTGTVFTPNVYTGSTGNLIAGAGDNPVNTWLTKEFAPVISDSLLALNLNQFDLGFGLSVASADYYLENITFVLKSGEGEVTECPVIKTLSNPTIDPDGSQPGWDLTNNVKDALWLDTIAQVKYLVIETTGGDSPDTFGKFNLVWQGGNGGITPDQSWGMAQVSDSSVIFDRTGKVVSMAIDLKNVMGADYDALLTWNNWLKIIIANWDFPSLVNGIGFQNAYLTSDFTKPAGAVDLKDPSYGFIFEGSVNCATSEKIVTQPIVAPAYGITNGIVVNAANENVSIYGIDGRLLKQVIANNQIIDMARGLYIVKVGAAKAVKVVVK